MQKNPQKNLVSTAFALKIMIEYTLENTYFSRQREDLQ